MYSIYRSKAWLYFLFLNEGKKVIPLLSVAAG